MKLFFATLLLMLIAYNPAYSQCKSFRVNDRGDTLNCIDNTDQKQGKWINHYDQLRGEPGFEEEGVYKNNLKEGKWRKYDLNGFLIAIENYRWGNKDGTQQYFYQGEITREESWRAIDPEKKYDTVDVPDVYDQYKVTRKVVKVESYSLKEGVWKYYRPGSLSIIKTETYVLDKLQIPRNEFANNTDTTTKAPVKKVIPAQVKEFEKKNSGKKAIKYKDGSVGF
ncbi:MAG: hypothetical protein WCP65_00610 [Bacteroidota bacterium]